MSDNGVNDDLLGAFLDDELADHDIDRLLDSLDCDKARGRACRQSMAARAMSGGSGACVDISAAVRQAIAQEALPQARVVNLSDKRSQRAGGRMAMGRWRVPVAGMALAASAALAAVIVIKPNAQNNATGSQVAMQESEPNNVALAQAPATASDLLQVVNRQAAQPSGAPAYSSAPVQRVAAGAIVPSAAASSGREMVIAAPSQQRAVEAQWSLVSQSEQNALAQQRMQQQLNTMLINHARFGSGTGLPGALGYARVAVQPQSAQK